MPPPDTPLRDPAASAARLEAQLAALRRIALAVAQPGGDAPFEMLVGELAAALQVASTFVAVFADDTRQTLRTLAARLDGRTLARFDYGLKGTPCAQVVGRDFRYVAHGVAAEFPRGTLFAAKGMDSYAAYPLHGGDGAPLGLLVAMDREPIAAGDAGHAEAVLKVVAVRAAAEIERLAAGEALRRSEASYRAIFDAAEDAVFIHDWDSGAILDVNPKACETCGWSREELRRLTVADISAGVPPYTGADAARWLALAREGRCPPFEWRRRNKDGSLHWDEVRLKPAMIDGRRHVLTFARDITRQKAGVEALRAREQQYRAIFDSSADALVLWSRELRVADVNESFTRMTGYTREDVIGLPHGARLDAEDVGRRLGLIRAALAGGEGLIETRAARKDGSRFDIELRYLPVSFGGEPHALAIGRDISERRAAEAERAALEAQLRQAQKMEAIGQLTGGIAHDFNNILTGVIGYLVMGQERAELLADATLSRQLGQAQLAAQRARDLIAQMLAFARRRPARRQPLALASLLRQSVQLLRATLPSSIVLDAHEFGAEGDAASPQVEGDAVQLEQVLFNLCINARDAMDGAGRIRLGLREACGGWQCGSCGEGIDGGRWVELSVTDDGAGIGAEVMPRMFEPFYSTKEVGKGSGMGLAMVHGIVHDHRGHVCVDSVPGHGARFRVLLPRADRAPAPAAAAALPTAPAGRDSAREPLAGRVLLVEDETLVGDYLAEQLRQWGLSVTLHRDPHGALDWLAQDVLAADLLITDHTMPQMTGLQLAREATRLRAGLPVLLISGNADGFDAALLADSGVRAALPKPIDAERLRVLLHEALAVQH